MQALQFLENDVEYINRQTEEEPVYNRKVRLQRIKTMFGQYIDQCLYIIQTVVLAELIWRLYRTTREYVFYRKHYMSAQPLWQILRRAFTCNQASLITLMTVVVIVLLRYGSTSRFPLVPYQYLSYMPIYWIYSQWNWGHSTLSYVDWIRGDHGLDYAEGMASSFYYGYLRIILPPNVEYQSKATGLRERMDAYSARHNITFGMDKLVILLSTELYIKGEIESKFLALVDPLELVVRNRAGVIRPYRNSVYRINQKINNKFYYVALEGATPLLTYYEASQSQPSSTWQMREMKRELLFKFYRHLTRLLNQHETRGLAHLLIYDMYTSDGRPQDVGELIISLISNQNA